MAQITIPRDSGDLVVNVHSVNSRAVDLTINSNLDIDMSVPIGMSDEMIRNYISMNRERILREYDKKKIRSHQALPITLDLQNGKIVYFSGQKLPFLGNMDLTLRIRYQDDYEGTGIFIEHHPTQGRCLVVKTDNDDPAFIRYCVMRYYRRCAEQIVLKKVKYFAKKLGLEYNTVRITGKMLHSPIRMPGVFARNIDIRNQTTLWGSCNRKKNLKFDWKLAMLPMEIIDYIIVHELSHIKVLNHSRNFWREVEKVMPEYNECGSWLNKHGKEYEIF